MSIHRASRLGVSPFVQVNSILDFASAEAGRMTATFQPTQIGTFVEDLASAFRSAIEAAGLEYSIKSALPDHLVVWVDRDKVEKMVYNLLGGYMCRLWGAGLY